MDLTVLGTSIVNVIVSAPEAKVFVVVRSCLTRAQQRRH